MEEIIMETKIIALSLLVILFIYTGWIWKKFGVLNSISHSYYKLKNFYKDQPGKQFMPYMFTLFMYSLAIPAAVCAFIVSEGHWYQFLGMFSGFPLAFVGAAPNYLEKTEGWVHYSATGISATASLAFTWLIGYGYISLICIGIAVLISLGKKNGKWTLIHPIWWFEKACIVSYCVTMITL